MPPMPMRVKKLPPTAARKVRMRNRAELQQREAPCGRAQPVAEQQRDREHQAAPSICAAAQTVLAEDLEHVGQQRDAGAEQHQPDDIERWRLLVAVVGQMAVHEVEAEQPDRHVEEEDDAPVQVADDEAAGDGAEHRADEAGIATKLMARTSSDFGKRAHHASADRPAPSSRRRSPAGCGRRPASWMLRRQAAQQRARA